MMNLATPTVAGADPSQPQHVDAPSDDFTVPPVNSIGDMQALLPRPLQVFLLQQVVAVLAGTNGQMLLTELNAKVLNKFGPENKAAIKALVTAAGGWRQMIGDRPSLFDWSGLPPSVSLRPDVTPDDAAVKLCDPTFIDNKQLPPVPSRGRRHSELKAAKTGAAGDSGQDSSVAGELGPDPNPNYRRKQQVASSIALSRQPIGPPTDAKTKGFSDEYLATRPAGRLAKMKLMDSGGDGQAR